MKKLSITKETLRVLDVKQDLDGVQGGARPSFTCPSVFNICISEVECQTAKGCFTVHNTCFPV